MHGNNLSRVFKISVDIEEYNSQLVRVINANRFPEEEISSKASWLQATPPKFYPEIHFRSVVKTLLPQIAGVS